MFALHPALGSLDKESGEFWMENPWETKGNNLSAFERHRVLLNAGHGKFVDVSHLSNCIDSDGRSVVAGDFNGDGMEDLMVRNAGGGPLMIFENRHPKSHWLKVTLNGVKSNRRGIGAKLKFEVNGKAIQRELYPHNSYQSQAPTILHVGLGAAAKVDRLTIRWPSGETQVLENLPANQHVRITEGKSEYSRFGATLATAPAGDRP